MKSPNSILTVVILTLALASPAAIADQAKKKPNRTNPGQGENLTQMRFAGMDRNHDGRITRDEWRGNDVSFNQHDWNGDGVLSGPEVTPGAQRPVDFASLDRNHDGRISLSEWPGCRALFNFLDLNDDGFLSPTELSQNGSLLIGGRLDALFSALDVNHDSRISRTEWTFDLTVFDHLDANHDSMLTSSELRPISGLLCGDDDEDDELAGFQRLDTNDDNRISRSEWRGSLRQFDRLDTNDDGFLSLDEFRHHH